jgi:hypothetical protein
LLYLYTCSHHVGPNLMFLRFRSSTRRMMTWRMFSHQVQKASFLCWVHDGLFDVLGRVLSTRM